MARPAFADDDLPGRVGRVADVAGELFLAPQDQPEQWTPIGVNYPVTTGDNLWVGNEGRAEVDFGAGQFRLAGDTNLHVSRLDDRQFALFVAQGRVSVRVRVLDPGETREHRHAERAAGAHASGPVSHRRERGSAAHARRRARGRGQRADAGGACSRCCRGRRRWSTAPTRATRASATASAPTASTRGRRTATAGTSAERMRTTCRRRWWAPPNSTSTARGRRCPNTAPSGIRPPSSRTGRRTATATGPTSARGARRGSTPRRGATRRSTTAAGSSSAAAGAGARARTSRAPLWAPALVGWTGGPGWGVSVSVGGPVYGWVPLAWGEPYRPWWNRCSHGCWDRYNRPYAVNVTRVRPDGPPPTRYRNASAPGGLSAMSGNALVTRRPVRENLVVVPNNVATSAPVLAGVPLGAVANRDESRRERAGDGAAPPPASTFYPTHARPSGTPGTPGTAAGRPAATTSAPGTVTRSRTDAPAPAYVSPGARPAPAATPPSVGSATPAPAATAPPGHASTRVARCADGNCPGRDRASRCAAVAAVRDATVGTSPATATPFGRAAPVVTGPVGTAQPTRPEPKTYSPPVQAAPTQPQAGDRRPASPADDAVAGARTHGAVDPARSALGALAARACTSPDGATAAGRAGRAEGAGACAAAGGAGQAGVGPERDAVGARGSRDARRSGQAGALTAARQ